MSRYWSKFCYLKGGWVTLNENFRGKGASSINDFWQQRSRVPGLSRGVVCVILPSIVLIQYRRVTYRQTDRRQTDGTAMAYSKRNVCVHVC